MGSYVVHLDDRGADLPIRYRQDRMGLVGRSTSLRPDRVLRVDRKSFEMKLAACRKYSDP